MSHPKHHSDETDAHKADAHKEAPDKAHSALQDLIQKMHEATAEVAAQLTKLLEQVSALVASSNIGAGEYAGLKECLDAEIARLKVLGADPAHPCPPCPPALLKAREKHP